MNSKVVFVNFFWFISIIFCIYIYKFTKLEITFDRLQLSNPIRHSNNRPATMLALANMTTTKSKQTAKYYRDQFSISNLLKLPEDLIINLGHRSGGNNSNIFSKRQYHLNWNTNFDVEYNHFYFRPIKDFTNCILPDEFCNHSQFICVDYINSQPTTIQCMAKSLTSSKHSGYLIGYSEGHKNIQFYRVNNSIAVLLPSFSDTNTGGIIYQDGDVSGISKIKFSDELNTVLMSPPAINQVAMGDRYVPNLFSIRLLSYWKKDNLTFQVWLDGQDIDRLKKVESTESFDIYELNATAKDGKHFLTIEGDSKYYREFAVGPDIPEYKEQIKSPFFSYFWPITKILFILSWIMNIFRSHFLHFQQSLYEGKAHWANVIFLGPFYIIWRFSQSPVALQIMIYFTSWILNRFRELPQYLLCIWFVWPLLFLAGLFSEFRFFADSLKIYVVYYVLFLAALSVLTIKKKAYFSLLLFVLFGLYFFIYIPYRSNIKAKNM